MPVWINGRESEPLDPLDRGLQYGDGLFETMAVVDGRLRFLDWHLERLEEGARRLGIPLPASAALRAEIAAALPSGSAVVKLIITRGQGARGYRPPTRAEPTRILAVHPWPDCAPANRTTGVRLRWCRTRLGRNPALAGIKHLNRLEQVLARAEWDDADVAEGLMMDDRDQVIGGTQANLFARIADDWVTPALVHSGVAGIMRRAFQAWCAGQGYPVVVRVLPEAELEQATAVLLTNSLIGAWPVREIAGRALAIDPRAGRFNAWVDQQ